MAVGGAGLSPVAFPRCGDHRRCVGFGGSRPLSFSPESIPTNPPIDEPPTPSTLALEPRQ